MRRVPYLQVLQAAATLMTGSAEVPDAELAATLKVFVNRRAGEFWETFFWPEWTLIEQRQFRPDYDDGETYEAGTELYYGAEDAYYQVLQETTGNPPTDGDGNIDTTYWAESKGCYDGLSDYDETETYAVGDQVRDPSSGNAYQSITSSNIGNPVTDATNWGLLTPFVRSIDLEQFGETKIGEVRKCWSSNPQISNNACEIKFLLYQEEIIVRGLQTKVWVEFRLRPPSWTGETYDATAVYSAATEDQIYFTDDEFYRALGTGIPAGESPESAPQSWERLDFPYIFRDCVAQAAFADLVRADGQQEKYQMEFAEANRLLKREYDKIERQQGQHRTLAVRTR